MENRNYHLEEDPEQKNFWRMVSDRSHVIQTIHGPVTVEAGEKGGAVEKSVTLKDSEGNLWVEEDSRIEGSTRILLDPGRGDEILICNSRLRDCMLRGGSSILFGVNAVASLLDGSMDLYDPCVDTGAYAITILDSSLTTANSFAIISTVSTKQGAVEILGSRIQEFALMSREKPDDERRMQILIEDSEISGTVLFVSDRGRYTAFLRAVILDSILYNSSLADCRVVHTVGKRIFKCGGRIGNEHRREPVLKGLEGMECSGASSNCG